MQGECELMIVGLVTEGSTDIGTLEVYLREWARRFHWESKFEVRALQPPIDTTSGKFGDGGWQRVRAWCEENPTGTRKTTLFEPLFAGEQPLDFVLIQLDADVVSEYVQEFEDLSLPDELTAKVRADIVREVLARWLWESEQLRLVDPHEAAHCLVAAVQSLESWFIAALDKSVEEPEEVDPETELMRIAPELPTKVRRGQLRLRKMIDEWRDLAERTKHEVEHIASCCPSFERLFQYVHRRFQDFSL